jgi:hypothetical protein
VYLLLSGEGPSDIGVCRSSAVCDRADFQEGPMAIIVDQLIELNQGFEMSHLVCELVSYVSESYLAENKQPPQRKAMSLRGKKKPAETKYFFENARALASIARNKATEVDDNVIAVLFRDADGTSSAGRGNWNDKRNSIIAGFRAEDYDLGVAMIPKPKSEAWLLCATKQNPYQHCDCLEDESGNDKGKSPLKEQLAKSLVGKTSSFDMAQLINNKQIDITRIDMLSFNTFKSDLEKVVKMAMGVV